MTPPASDTPSGVAASTSTTRAASGCSRWPGWGAADDPHRVRPRRRGDDGGARWSSRLWERGLRRDELCGCGQPFSRCAFWQAVKAPRRSAGGTGWTRTAWSPSWRGSMGRQYPADRGPRAAAPSGTTSGLPLWRRRLWRRRPGRRHPHGRRFEQKQPSLFHALLAASSTTRCSTASGIHTRPTPGPNTSHRPKIRDEADAFMTHLARQNGPPLVHPTTGRSVAAAAARRRPPALWTSSAGPVGGGVRISGSPGSRCRCLGSRGIRS